MDEPLQIAICEDTPEDQATLLDILSRCSVVNSPTVFSCGEDFLAAYAPGKFDLLLSDIYMDGITGVDTVSRVRELDSELPVAFVTTSSDFTLEGYRLSVLKYIEKPYRQREVEDILALAQMKKQSAPRLTFQRGGRDDSVPFSRILYLEQDAHHVLIYCTGAEEPLVISCKLAALLPQLEEEYFFLPHKSYAVHLSFVRAIDAELRCFVMQDGSNIPIRRESLPKAKQALRDYLFSRTRGRT